MFGKSGRGGKAVGGGDDPDWDAKQFEKGAAGGGYGDKDDAPFNDAATGVSVSSGRVRAGLEVLACVGCGACVHLQGSRSRCCRCC